MAQQVPYSVSKSAISSTIDINTYLAAAGKSTTANPITVDQLISHHCTAYYALPVGYFDISSHTAFDSSINITKESHEEQVTFDGFKTTSKETSITALLPGTSPHFVNELCRIQTPGTYTIARTAEKLQIGAYEFKQDRFTDGVVPLRLIVVLQGAGGGGGGNRAYVFTSSNGPGGGSGGLVSGVLDLCQAPVWSFYVGAGGSGGGADNGGAKGGDTYICYKGSNDVLYKVASAGGGGGAAAPSTDGSAASGGSGGTNFTLDTNFYTLLNAAGVKGGNGAGFGGSDSQSGNTPPGITIKCTTRTNDVYSALTLSGQAGGAIDRGNTGGGGAGSWFGAGGSPVWSESGNPGGLGAGGGGACWDIVQPASGGSGGNGVAVFYY